MFKIVQNSPYIKDKNGFCSYARGWVIVDENNVRVSSLFYYNYGTALAELKELETKEP